MGCLLYLRTFGLGELEPIAAGKAVNAVPVAALVAACSTCERPAGLS